MKKIIAYELINSDPKFLHEIVNQLIEDGWQPYGTPFKDEDMPTFYQAMVRYEEAAQ